MHAPRGPAPRRWSLHTPGPFTSQHPGREDGRTAEAANQRPRGGRAPRPSPAHAPKQWAGATKWRKWSWNPDKSRWLARRGREPSRSAAARAALASRSSQPAPTAWSSARGHRVPTSGGSLAARRRRGHARSREPLKGGPEVVGLGQTR